MKISQHKKDLIANLERETEAHNKQMAILNRIPESLDVNGIYTYGVHLAHATYEENMKTLHLIRQHCGNYKLDAYGATNKDSLYLAYTFEGFELFMNCTDPDNALAIVSDGKCKFEDTEEVIEATEKTISKGVTVVCPVA